VSCATVIELGKSAAQLRVEIDPPRAHGAEAQIDRRWSELCAANPRLFNGRILAFLGADLGANVIRARVDEYKRMAVQPEIDTGVIQFGVTGLLTAEKPRLVLLGKRSGQTHVHPGRWELAPSGGVDAPDDHRRTLLIEDLHRQIAREVAEEIGSSVPMRARPIALCHDPVAPSTDVIFDIALDAPVPPAGNWEYDELAWVPIDNLAFELRARNIDLIAPSRAVLQWRRWLP